MLRKRQVGRPLGGPDPGDFEEQPGGQGLE